jgi:ribosome-associated protein
MTPVASRKRGASQPTPRPKMIDVVLQSLDDAKAANTVTVDIAGKSPLTDHLVVTSGRSHRHVGAVADQLTRALKDKGFGSARVEGLPQSDWVLVDAGDVIVHIFRPEVREFYNLEKLWSADTLDHEAG